MIMNKFNLLFVFLSFLLIKINGLTVVASTIELFDKASLINFTVPRCDRVNEYFTCGSLCQNTCRHLREPCLSEHPFCKDSCYCLPGYARDDRNSRSGLTCIPEWQCDNPKGKCIGVNEVFNSKGSPCQTTCTRLDLPCPIFDETEVPGCFCEIGFARDSDGVCVHQDNCSPGRCSDVHEVYKLVNCPKYCKNIRGCNSNDIYLNDSPECVCQTGYVNRRYNKTCVPEGICYDLKFQQTYLEE